MKKLFIILGMYRSGTSVAVKISQCMGAYLGEENELMGASLGNPDGHFENMEVARINDRILYLCGIEWYSMETAVPDYDNPNIKKEMEGIKDIIYNLLEKSDTVVIKDPRICVLLPLWDKILKALEVEVHYIWVFRNPLEVAESLKKRDGYSGNYGLLLWIHYHISILKYLCKKEYLLINYRDILGQSQALEDLSRLFGCTLDDTLKGKLKQVIKQDYCHSNYSYQDVRDTQNKLLSDMYGTLLERRETDVSEWEKQYKKAVVKREISFIDYEVLQNIRSLEGKEIIIYGAGNYGKRAAEMLRKLNFSDYNFCDKDIRKQGISLMDGTVFPVAEVENRKNLLVIIAIGNERIRKEMEEVLAYLENVTFLSYFALEKAYKYFVRDYSTLFSEAETLCTWYRALDSRASKVKNACKSSVIVYQNGKVGSSSVSMSLQKAGIENAHVHRFFFKKDIVGEVILGEGKREFARTSNFLNFQSSEYVKSIKREMKYKKIITMVREPISVDLSTVFQWIGTGISDRFFAKHISQGETFIRTVSELMVKIQDGLFEWFDDELNELYNVDVYSCPFDKERGYSVISKDGTEILILKAEKLSDLTDVIRNFVGSQQFEIVNENVGSNKEYARLYKEVKQRIELPREYVEHYYTNNPYMNHFYLKEEQTRFLNKWERHIKN